MQFAAHLLAENYRDLAQYYEEYQAFQKTREAALLNLVGQWASWNRGLGVIYLNVLQARTSWGDAVDAEAQSLLQYNTEFASLQEQMGTILEVHGVRFVEERYCSIGPMGRQLAGRWYPRARRPGPYEEQYERGPEPAENIFQLDEPAIPGQRQLDRPRPAMPTPDTLPGALPDGLMRPLREVEPFRLPGLAPTPPEIPIPAGAPQKTRDGARRPERIPVPEPERVEP